LDAQSFDYAIAVWSQRGRELQRSFLLAQLWVWLLPELQRVFVSSAVAARSRDCAGATRKRRGAYGHGRRGGVILALLPMLLVTHQTAFFHVPGDRHGGGAFGTR
jgi:hypothetical protein